MIHLHKSQETREWEESRRIHKHLFMTSVETNILILNSKFLSVPVIEWVTYSISEKEE